MQAQSYDPSQLNMTPRALDHVRRQLRKKQATALVLGVSETGCNGYMYDLQYVDPQTDVSGLKTFEFDEVRVYVSNSSWDLIKGTEIDFQTQGLNSSLKFQNPNADTLCGCGESFSLSGT